MLPNILPGDNNPQLIEDDPQGALDVAYRQIQEALNLLSNAELNLHAVQEEQPADVPVDAVVLLRGNLHAIISALVPAMRNYREGV